MVADHQSGQRDGGVGPRKFGLFPAAGSRYRVAPPACPSYMNAADDSHFCFIGRPIPRKEDAAE
jgi:hypothetical protein